VVGLLRVNRQKLLFTFYLRQGTWYMW